MRTPSVPHLAIPKKLAEQKREERGRQSVPRCPVCKQICKNDDFRCRECDGPVVVGEMVSQGSGTVPRGHAFALRARDYQVGRSFASDYIIPDDQLPNEIFELRYLAPDRFAIVFDPNSDLITINDKSAGWNYRLADGDIIRFGAETFIYRLEAVQASGAGTAHDRLRLGLDRYRSLTRILKMLYAAEDFGTLCQLSVHAVLKISGLDRAVFFLVEETDEGESFLRQIYSATREEDGKIDETDILRVSQSILTRALSEGGTVLVEDTGRQIDRSRSVMALDLRALVCMPITVPLLALPKGERTYQPAYCLGMVYADSVDPMLELPGDAHEFLTLIAQTLSVVMLQCQSAPQPRDG